MGFTAVIPMHSAKTLMVHTHVCVKVDTPEMAQLAMISMNVPVHKITTATQRLHVQTLMVHIHVCVIVVTQEMAQRARISMNAVMGLTHVIPMHSAKTLMVHIHVCAIVDTQETAQLAMILTNVPVV